MQGTKAIKNRIRSAKNMEQVTKAMEMVASARFRRCQERAELARPYAAKMREVIASLAGGSSGFRHPMLERREVKKTGYLVITSDRGLAGGYNANLLRMVEDQIRSRHQSPDEYVILVIGRKGADYLEKRGYPVVKKVIGLSDFPTFADIKDIASTAVSLFAKETYDELYLYYNHFVNPVTQQPRGELLLPLANLMDDLKSEGQEGVKRYVYEYEPSPEEVLSALLPKYAESLIFAALLDAKASEQAARMTAMGNASDNAGEMIKMLTLQYNRARQAAITQEVAEIVGGANALQG
ncbi:MAG: ATP synthase F1 subunit gamma [Bacillota bacterium]|nr:F0F1 ATP synthase subunit gamma [Bacillota bacterium]